MVKIKSGPVELLEVREAASGQFEAGGAGAAADPDQERAFYEFQAAAEQEGGGYTLWVFRVPTDHEGKVGANTKLVRLFTAPIDRYKLDEILSIVTDDYMGPADVEWLVRIQIRKDDENGLKRNMLFVVRRKRQKANESGDQNLLSEVSRLLSEQAERSQQMMLQLQSAQQRQPAADPMDGALKIVTVMTGMMAPMLAAVAGRAPAAVDSAGPFDQMTKMFAAMRSLKGLSDDFGGGGGGGAAESDGGTLALAKDVIVPGLASLAQIIAATKGGQAQPSPGVSPPVAAPAMPAFQPAPPPAAPPNVLPFPPQPPAAAPATGAQPFPPQPPQPEPAMNDAQMLQHLKTVIEGLSQMAGPGSDPKAMADQVMSLMPDDPKVDDMIYTRLSAPNWFEGLQLLVPAIAPQKEWFTLLRDEILKGFEDGTPGVA
jgi:hypothetical protein